MKFWFKIEERKPARRSISIFILAFLVIFLPELKAGSSKEALLKILFNIDRADSDSISNMPSMRGVKGHLTSALESVVSLNFEKAEYEAKAAGYGLREIYETDTHYSLLRPIRDKDIHATIVIDHKPIRDLIVEAPHPMKDRATGEQAALLFKALGARALILAGANRCASRTETNCSGQTRVCDRDFREPYRNSDVAHAIENSFYLAHSVLSSIWSRSVIIQPHGFSNPDSDVWFVLSDGSTRINEDDNSIVGRLRDRMRALLGRHDRVISCHDKIDKDIKTRRLCGTTNVQGRHLNGSIDICRRKTGYSSGRFIHIEQVFHEVRHPFRHSRSRLQNYPGSSAILEGLAWIIPCINKINCGKRSLP